MFGSHFDDRPKILFYHTNSVKNFFCLQILLDLMISVLSFWTWNRNMIGAFFPKRRLELFKVLRSTLKYCVIFFEESSCSRSFTLSNVLDSFGGLAWAIHSFMQNNLFQGIATAMYSFRSYMKQLIFDSSYLLRAATFLEGHFYSVYFLRAVCWINHPNSCHPSFGVRHLFLPQKE